VFTESFFVNINRSLFELHKPLFAFLLCVRILQGDELVDRAEWRYLLSGTSGTPAGAPNPDPSWLTEQMWVDILFISANLPAFRGLEENVSENVAHYKEYFMCHAPHRQPLAGEWQEKLNRFQKLIFLRSMRPDKLMLGVQDFVAANLGERFIKPPPFDIEASYKDSTPHTPLVFVLSQGADPLADFTKLANACRMQGKVDLISLGQGQGAKAERLLRDGCETGRWVLLQNCHLATSWMPSLERLVESYPESINPSYRLWLTSMPNKHFPVSILQNGIKMTNEPPKGMTANMSRSLVQYSNDWLKKSNKTKDMRKILFSLCFFHALVQERRKFGPLGWNIAYEFTTGDLNCCVEQVYDFLQKYEDVPWKVITQLSGEIHYGGRVTDDWDRRYLMTAIQDFTNASILVDGYPFSESGSYTSIAPQDIEGYLEHLEDWPINTPPELFGLHDNAAITCARAETFGMLETILLTESGSAGGGSSASMDETVVDMAKDILSRLKDPFDEDAFRTKYATSYYEAMNTVLTQEAARFNKLLRVVIQSLKDIQLAVRGLVVMSGALEEVYKAMFVNQVPTAWAAVAYPSLKPLAAWVTDLEQRLAMIQEWYDKGKPHVFWISGFFFPQAFLTGTQQNAARKKKIPIDTISFVFDFKRDADQIKSSPETGCYIKGVFIEGARFNTDEMRLAESHPKVLFEPMPVISLMCEEGREPVTDQTPGIYLCPVYKTLRRAGTLSTTGHSTNFVVTAQLPTKEPSSHWIKRGTAMFCALNY